MDSARACRADPLAAHVVHAFAPCEISTLLLFSFTTLFLLIKHLLRIFQTIVSDSGESRGGSENNEGLNMAEPRVILNCVFCLSEIGEGEEEIREARCGHAFHKGCLDKWFENRRFSCPLCRRCLRASPERTAKEEFDREEIEDDEGDDSGPLLLAFVQSEWLGRCLHFLVG
ncbi:RING-H2 finger protein ATL14 [Platanthera zijinensis]|uniref:RING-H2 finger protein ATL14 n=1 Tax=Platanthera zijinensis TaxID=2320716 RepID=A0AAP0BM93_9ASPA